MAPMMLYISKERQFDGHNCIRLSIKGIVKDVGRRIKRHDWTHQELKVDFSTQGPTVHGLGVDDTLLVRPPGGSCCLAVGGDPVYSGRLQLSRSYSGRGMGVGSFENTNACHPST